MTQEGARFCPSERRLPPNSARRALAFVPAENRSLLEFPGLALRRSPGRLSRPRGGAAPPSRITPPPSGKPEAEPAPEVGGGPVQALSLGARRAEGRFLAGADGRILGSPARLPTQPQPSNGRRLFRVGGQLPGRGGSPQRLLRPPTSPPPQSLRRAGPSSPASPGAPPGPLGQPPSPGVYRKPVRPHPQPRLCCAKGRRGGAEGLASPAGPGRGAFSRDRPLPRRWGGPQDPTHESRGRFTREACFLAVLRPG